MAEIDQNIGDATQSGSDASDVVEADNNRPASRSFAKSVLFRLILPTIFGLPAGLGLFLFMPIDDWPSALTASDQPPADAAPKEIPPSTSPLVDQPLRIDEALQHADELLVAGNVVSALAVYEQLAAGNQGQPGEMLEYRLALCAELLGRRDRALAAYTALAGQSSDDKLAVAAKLGAARVWFAFDDLETATALLCSAQLEAALHGDAMLQYGGDFTSLLAHIRARQVHADAPVSLTDDLGIAQPPLSWSPLASLDVNGDQAETSASYTTLKEQGITVLHKFGDEPADIQLNVHLERIGFDQICQRLSNSVGKPIISSKQAQQAVVGNAMRLALDDVQLDELLDNLLGPFGLAWQNDESAIQIRSLAELTDEQAEWSLQQLASRSLFRTVTLHPNHPLCASSYLALGNQAFRQGEYQNAIALYRHLQREYPRSNANREAWFNEAKAHLLLGDLNEARGTFLKVADSSRGHPLESAAHLYVGRLDLDSGKPRTASMALKRALASSSQKEIEQVAAVTLASAYLLWEKPHAANGVLMEHRAVLDMGPYTETAAFLSALAQFNALDELQRNEVAGRALIVTATHTDAGKFFGMHGFLLLGQAYQSLGYIDHMAQVYAEALESEIHGEPRNRLLMRLAEYEYERGNLAQFEWLIREVVENGHGPRPRRALLRLAAAALAHGKDDECLALCQQLLNDGERSEDDADILTLMGRVYERRSDHYNAALCFAGMKPAAESPSLIKDEN